MTLDLVDDIIQRAETLDGSRGSPSASPAAVADGGPILRAQEAGELRDRLLRLGAELENYRKRAQRELEATRRYGIEQLLADLLPVLDAVDRALGQAGEAPGSFVEGVRLIAREAERVLARHGVRSFASLGEAFDPARHDAVGIRPVSDAPPGVVIEEQLKGYLLHDRLLRAARVVVSASPQGGSPTTE